MTSLFLVFSSYLIILLTALSRKGLELLIDLEYWTIGFLAWVISNLVQKWMATSYIISSNLSSGQIKTDANDNIIYQ